VFVLQGSAAAQLGCGGVADFNVRLGAGNFCVQRRKNYPIKVKRLPKLQQKLQGHSFLTHSV